MNNNNNNGIWIWLETDVNRWDSRSTSTMTLFTVNIQKHRYQLTHERICCCANWKIPQRAEHPVAPIRTCCMHEIAKLPQRHLFDTGLFQHRIQIPKLNEEQKADNPSEILSTIDGNPRTNSKDWSGAEKLRVDHSWGEQSVILSHTEWHECEVRKYLYSCTWQAVPFYQGPGKERRSLERLFPTDRLTTINSITEEVMKRVFQLTPKPQQSALSRSELSQCHDYEVAKKNQFNRTWRSFSLLHGARSSQ